MKVPIYTIGDENYSNEIAIHEIELDIMRRLQNLKKSPTCFDNTVVFIQQRQNKWDIFSNLCGLFRRAELYISTFDIW